MKGEKKKKRTTMMYFQNQKQKGMFKNLKI